MAISKAIASKDAKEARGHLVQGRYEVDTVVRVQGEVVVGKDGEKVATSSLVSEDFLLLTLRAAGVTREAAMAAIKAVASEYLSDWTGSKEDKKEAKRARKKALNKYDPSGGMKDIFGKIKSSLPKIPVRGSVKFEGSVEQISVGAEVVELEQVG
jgi:hypothetical protein